MTDTPPVRTAVQTRRDTRQRPESEQLAIVGGGVRRLTWLLVFLTFPLIWVGGLVTTTDAGMAVPDWPNTYGYNLFLYPYSTWLAGPWDIFVEHGHRLLGAIVGALTLLITGWLWLRGGEPAWRWLSLATLLAVIVQGVLGGLRVVLDQRLLAQIHGTTGPVFFALAVALATVCSMGWQHWATRAAHPALAPVRRMAWLVTGLVLAQIALGARLRHFPAGGDAGEFQIFVVFHLLLAAVLTVHIVLLVVRAWKVRSLAPEAARAAHWTGGLIAGQLTLGLVTWVVNYNWPAWLGEHGGLIQAHGFWQSTLTTAHVAVGSLLLATALTTALRTWRGWGANAAAACGEGSP